MGCLEGKLRLIRKSLERETRHDHADAAATAAKLRERGAQKPGSLYDAACCYALCVAGVAVGKKVEELTDQDKAASESYAARALAVLREAIQKGFKDVVHIKQDKNLDPLRSPNVEECFKLIGGGTVFAISATEANAVHEAEKQHD